MLALLVPHSAKSKDDFEDYVVSVDELENVTGIDFYSSFDDELENELESETDAEFWF